MKTLMKRLLTSILGNNGFSTLDLWLKILRVYFNLLTSSTSRISLHPELLDEGDHVQLKVQGAEVFFGYYDHSPISKDGCLCLAVKIDSSKVTIFSQNSSLEKSAEVGYFDLHDIDSGFHKIDETLSWCWQQGARLRWFPGKDKEIIYNTINERKYCSVVKKITGELVRYHDLPIYDLNSDGSKALSLNFSRLQRLRPGYGYSNFSDQTESNLCPSDDGVWVYDLGECESRLLFSLKFLSNFQPVDSMNGAEHYVNHLSWSCTGKSFLFFHIWCRDGKRCTRMFTCTAEGKELKVTAEKASHYCWLSDDEVVVVNASNGKLSYDKFNINSGKREALALWMPLEDGHPTVVSDRYIVTDSYPDKYGQQKLFLCDSMEKKITSLGSFYSSPLSQGEVRCDLHPRYSESIHSVCFDSIFSGQRTINILKMDSVISG